MFLSPVVQGDMIDTAGMKPWEVCALCHSLNGISRMAKFPKLAGQKAHYIEKQFWDFHHQRRDNDGGQMQGVTMEVEPQSVKEIAHYFESLPPPPALPRTELAISEGEFQRGQELFYQGDGKIIACVNCHDDSAHLAPWLFAQHEDYLVKQLSDFKAGSRSNDESGVMRQIAKDLSEDDIRSLAGYLTATQKRVPR